MIDMHPKRYAIVVEFDIDNAKYADFLYLVKENAATSLEKEEGCLCFDILESVDIRNRILLYEIYSDEHAFQVHLDQDHYKDFSRKVENMVRSKAVQGYFVTE